MPRCGDCGPGTAVIQLDPTSSGDLQGVGTPDDPYIFVIPSGDVTPATAQGIALVQSLIFGD